VDDGQAMVHVHVTPRLPPSAPPNADPKWIGCPRECSVAADRRVRCTTRWFIADTTGLVDLPAACDYVVLVSVAAT
jgi:hypothetical protein